MDNLEAKVRLLELAATIHARTGDNNADAIAKTAIGWYNDVSKWEKLDTSQIPQTSKTLTLPKK